MSLQFKNIISKILVTGLIISAVSVSFAQAKLVYTLINNVTHKYNEKLECEIAVAVSSDYSTVRVTRLDNRKSTYSTNYFARSPAAFHNYGLEINLNSELKLGGASIRTVEATFDFKDSHHDLVLKVYAKNPVTGKEQSHQKSFDLEMDFFKDSPRTCLK
jgi:hypothetical protein